MHTPSPDEHLISSPLFLFLEVVSALPSVLVLELDRSTERRLGLSYHPSGTFSVIYTETLHTRGLIPICRLAPARAHDGLGCF
jgi:hypothetical protein